jgi:hypothetical protein
MRVAIFVCGGFDAEAPPPAALVIQPLYSVGCTLTPSMVTCQVAISVCFGCDMANGSDKSRLRGYTANTFPLDRSSEFSILL